MEQNLYHDIPMLVINGKTEGDTVLVTAGIHSTEYIGIQAAVELAKEISPSKIRGTVMIMPVVNVSGFEQRTQSVCYEDGKNIYHVFPGDSEGTEAEKLSAALADLLENQIDYYIDLHSGDRFETLIPHVFHVKTADEMVSKKSLEMATYVDAEYRIEVPEDCEGAVAWAASKGIPGILIERGSMGTWSQEEVRKTKEDVLRVMQHLGILKSDKGIEKFAQASFKKVDAVKAMEGGLWYPAKKVGEAFIEGETLGYMKDIFGNVKQECLASQRGMILYQVGSLNALKDDVLVAFACY